MVSSFATVLLCFISFYHVMGQFTNEITQPDDGTVKEYTFVVQHRLGMVLYNDVRESGSPVVYRNDQFSRRDAVTSVNQADCEQVRNLTAAELQRVITGDGFYKKLFTINGQIPGPSIIVREGTQVVVRVKNELIQEGITLHWHGMVQRKTPWMDGVGSISQCPISPGETFTYRFLAFPEGTHWYHSHTGTTRSDGLFGALVVVPKENEPKQDFYKEYIMMVHDWTREDSRDVVNEVYWELERYNPGYGNTNTCYYQTKQPDGTEVGPSPSVSLLVNGKGYHFLRDVNFRPERILDLSRPQDYAENPNLPLERFTVRANEVHRFRVIGTAMLYAIKISIDQHSLTILSSDGNEVKEKRVSQLIINTGERYDFSLDAMADVGNYWIRLETLESTHVRNPPSMGFHPRRGFAILHYEGASADLPASAPDSCTRQRKCVIMNCPYRVHLDEDIYQCQHVTNLTGDAALLKRFPTPEIPTAGDLFEQFINFHFSGTVAQRSSVNGHQMVLPSAPPQTYPSYDPRAVCPDTCTEHCVCTYIIEIPLGRVVQLTLLNMGLGAGITGTAHPVHLHGHHFHVMKMGFPTYDENGTYVSDNEDIMCGSPRCNAARWSDATWRGDTVPDLRASPVIKDTVIVPVGGYVVLRFKADNPGYWFAHCHIEIHQVEGMSFIIKEGEDNQMPRLPNGFPTCGNFDWSEEDFQKALTAGARSILPSQMLTMSMAVLIPYLSWKDLL